MRLTRVFHDGELSVGDSIELSRENARHLVTVLRLKQGQEIILFNGQEGEYLATITEAYKGRMTVAVMAYHEVNRESSLNITLVQGIAKTQRMDYSLQKSVELGVSEILPVLTERGNTTLKASVMDKKQAHWLGVIISAAEQSGRTKVPSLQAACSLDDYLHKVPKNVLKLVLDPQANTSFKDIQPEKRPVHVLVGPEGGLSTEEIERAESQGFQGVRMGPRILRTETASSAALGILQALWGDMDAS